MDDNDRQLVAKKQMSIVFCEITRPGKRSHNYGKIHHFAWENSLFRLGHVQVRKLFVYQRV